MRKPGVVGILALLALTVGTATAPAWAQDGSLRERIRQRMQERQQARDSPSSTEEVDVKAKITKPGNYTYSIDHEGLKRTYLVHVPAKYTGAVPVPLLISMHGGGAHMEYQASDENYGQIAKSEKEGFVIVFPNGYSKLGGKLATFNAGNCCGPARDKNVDDVGFIRQIVANLEAQLNIDRSRIFATGMSNGGLMAQRLACDMSDIVKAIAPVAGTDNTKSCNPQNPVAVLQIHAKNDDHLPFNGGRGAKSFGSQVTEFTSVPESIGRWVKRNGCNATAKRVLDKPGAYCDRYSQCRGNADVELCVTDVGGHSWPGAGRTRGEPASQAIKANDLMWDFFMSR